MYVLFEFLHVLLYIAYSYCEAVFRLVVARAPKSVHQKLVVITGGAQGIGRLTAELLAKKGARVVLWDIDEKTLQSTVDDLKTTGTEVFSYKCDVRSCDDVMKTAAQVQHEIGDVDILINNAGILKCRELTDLSEEDIKQTMGVNIMAHFWTLKAFLPAMMMRNEGHLVSISSYAGILGSPLLTDYTASKFAVRGLADAVQRELRQKSLSGIKLTTVYPLFTNTAMVKNLSPYAKMKNRFGRLLEPMEVATAIVEGILRDKREIYIPGNGILLSFLIGALPWKGQQALVNFLDLRFTSVKD